MKKAAAVFLSASLVLPNASLAWATEGVDENNDQSGVVQSDEAQDVVSGVNRKGGTWTFERATGTLTFGDPLDMESQLKRIPEYKDIIDNKLVKRLVYEEGVTTLKAYNALSETVEEVVIPSSVTELKFFDDWTNLSKVTIADNSAITAINGRCFANDEKLTSIDLSQTRLTTISGSPFQSSGVSSIVFPKTLETIGNQAFNGMGKLTEMSIPDGVTSIGAQVFQLCPKLERVDIPSTVESLSGSMFVSGYTKTCVTKVYVHGTKPLTESVADGLAKSKEEERDKCSILVEQQFDANYKGADAIDEQWVEWGTAIDSNVVPAPTREGYNFAGWYADPECTVAYDFSAAMEHGAVAYAKWEEQRTATVSFETNGGTTVGSQTVDEGGTVAKPATDPVRDGFRFTGWYADADCNTPFDFTQAINQDTTVYAGWVAQRTLTFDADGGNEIASATYDEGIAPAKPADPVRDGYTFKGWYSDAACTQEFDFGKALTQDATAYAKWEKNADQQDPKQDPQNPQQGSDQQNNQQSSNQQSSNQQSSNQQSSNNQQSANASQQTSANGSAAQSTVKTGDPATGAIPAVASLSALAAAVAAFARKRMARR